MTENGQVDPDVFPESVTPSGSTPSVAELQWREAHFRQAQTVANIGSWYFDLEADELTWSPEVYEIFGFDHTESPSFDSFLDAIHPDDRDSVQEAWERALEGAPYDIEHRIVVNGDTLWVREKAEIEFDSDEHPVEAIGIVQEVTDRKESEEKLQSFRKAVENAGHAIYMTDTDGTIEFVNKALVDQTGYSEEELLGENPRIFSSGRHGDAFYDRLWERIKQGNVWRAEVTNETRSGEFYTIDQTIAPVTNDKGEIVKFVAVNTDISSKRRRQQILQVYNRVLRHNLRNEITVITGRANLLKEQVAESLREVGEAIRETFGDPNEPKRDDQLPPPIDGDLDDLASHLRELESDIISQAVTIETVSKKLENLSEKARKTERGVSSTSSELVDCVQMVESKVDSLASDYPEAEISITNTGCRDELFQGIVGIAIEEVLENAIEHNDSDTPIVEVHVKELEESISISIADNGPGLPAYEKSVLEEGEETDLSHGSGLGLWLINWITTKGGGSLTIEENSPRGTVVNLTVPKLTSRRQFEPNDD